MMHPETALKMAFALGAAYLRIACGKVQILSDKYQVMMEMDVDKAARLAGLASSDLPESVFLDLRTVNHDEIWKVLRKK